MAVLSTTLVIDCHAHLVPKSWWAPTAPACLADLDGLRAQQDDAGVDISVIGNNWIRVPRHLAPIEVVRQFNEFAAEITASSKGRLLGLASAVPFGGEEFLKETERAITDLGLRGIMINSSVDGEYLDSPRARPFFELVARLDVPVFVHPPKVTIGAEKMEIYRLIEMVGRPFDTTLSLARFILSGGFERFPTLKLVCAHVGGALPMLPGRLNFGHELRHDPTFGPWEPDMLTRRPSEWIGDLYLDTMSFHPPAVLCAIASVGVDHVVYGSDFPPVHLPLRRSVDVVHQLPLHARDKAKILGGNAARLLTL